MMQAGVCLRQDTETILPELTEQHRIRQEEEELSGLESVHMAELETECAAPGLDTLESECVTAHSRTSYKMTGTSWANRPFPFYNVSLFFVLKCNLNSLLM
ncbi:hypothetical protein ANANG_G00027750 [Anguilla anguilla]|uniref:Uncharacterized protein n=1 Tax=Anguilla anguilla TaxID=7936 RepID=A0A9D3S3Q4_ANGAN|nr:hypothetical protein ANANG_G00027750 [Anguilla anguilla]